MRYTACLMLIALLMGGVSVLAEEPILVIDPHGHSNRISHLMFTSDGKTLISTSWDKTIRVWDVETGELRQTLRHQIGEGEIGKIYAAAISPDRKTLAIAGTPYPGDPHRNPIFLFDLDRGDLVGLLEGHPASIIMSLKFSSDGTWLASADDSGSLRIWDFARRSPTPLIMIDTGIGIFEIAFAPEKERLASAHVDNAIRLWEFPKDLPSGKPLQGLAPKNILKKHPAVISCLDYSPDGKYLVSGDFAGNYFLWESATGKVKKEFPAMETAGSVAFTPDSKAVLLNNGNTPLLFSVPKGKQLLAFDKHASPIETTAFSNVVTATAFYNNELVATAGGNAYDIYIWNVKTGKVKTHITGQGQRVEAVAFGEGLNIAFGNTSGGVRDMGPLERSFDLAEMQLNLQPPVESAFTRTRTEYDGKKLAYTFKQWYELRITGGGVITNSQSDGWVRSYTFTPAGDVVVGSSNQLRLHRIDGAVIREFIGHTGEIWAVSISKDGRILASASDDQMIKFWNLATGECLATLFIARDHEWVCWTPQGYYAASAGGEKYIGWQINQGIEKAAQYYPVSVFRKQFYHPELVKQTLLTGNFAQALAALQLKAAAVAEILPPSVEWLAPQESAMTSTQPTMRIQAKLHSEQEITSIKVLVNGRTQNVVRGLQIGTPPPQGNMVDLEIPLTPGDNELTIFAANANAGAVSAPRLVTYDASALKPELFMVSIGISAYQTDRLKLEFADDDAKAISRVFQAQAGKLYKRVTLKELYDRDARKQNILDALAWLKQNATQNDIVLLFVAAHGVNEQGEYYVVPADGDVEKIASTMISWHSFSESLANLPARVLFLLDTCHSGQLGQDFAVLSKQTDNTEALRLLASDEYGVVILAASTGKEFSLEHPDWQHGAFTKALLEAFSDGKADYSQDGVINLRELDLYVAERVEELTNNQQHPTTQKPSTITRFPIVQLN